MSLLRPLPSGTIHLFSPKGMAFLPAFVRARLCYLAEHLDWDLEEDKENEQEGAEVDTLEQEYFTYYEVQGMLGEGYYTISPGKHVSPIHFWIADNDNCQRSLYLGGSACWICPDSHYLFFDSIDPALLPEKPETNVWWCINYEEGMKVIKIIHCPRETITEDFPDGV